MEQEKLGTELCCHRFWCSMGHSYLRDTKQMSSTVFFIADLHLGHPAIIRFRKGGFSTLLHHDYAIVKAWNSVVTKRDTVYVLGDVAWTKAALWYLNLMKGNKQLVMGNHDRFSAEEYSKYFSRIWGVRPYKKQTILTHIPIHPMSFGKRDKGVRFKLNIHGHIHEHKVCTLDAGEVYPDIRYLNVSVDQLPDMKPISWDYIKEHHLP
jgi:calcineurin-like phosphoesterase family protein